MKVLTLNFLQCAVKSCKSSSASFPLHPKDCELVNDSVAPNLKLLQNILPRIDWKALGITAIELGFPMKLPENPPTAIQLEADSQMQRDLHILLIETQVSEGALVCGNCGHEYKIREGIANFLLPNHLV
ncbi:Multifunctional methyltransferase subunit trm112 [Golovinomyces cichoracearum]|uniref:Multifunctional methyltransferase subunit trm112 n=1 Tax=Golovinomyces cichoracearum TaxID=62708 RepID=A0A420IZF4_9PEZI|nr:Multifunctional methyltransferase subunit trm112 [Golovinomyces cichoracearum]RKF79936.1 Multifunctional methyltransferase subunit trm112 [Golovinomyces cichoracearum]